MPKISVIIPAYNSEKTIAKTIESVLKQTFTDWELIVINDSSEDSTLEIASGFQAKDSRIKVFSYPHAGGNVSRNRGLTHAVANMVSFLDADDIWLPDKLAIQYKALQENEYAKVAYSWIDYIDGNDEFLGSGMHYTVNGNVYQKLLTANFLENGSNPLIDKEALIKVGGFDESLSAGQDWDMWLRLANKFHFVAVPQVQILYRISPNSLSSNLTRQEIACRTVLEKAYSQSHNATQNLKNASFANLYKYLTCKALQPPLNRQKGVLAIRFLSKYVINDEHRCQRIKLTLKLLFKTILILLLPATVSTALLTTLKIKLKLI